MNRNIYIYCDGGLGNRLNSLLGGLWLANKFQMQSQVIWPVNNWCGAKFNELFEPTLKISDQNYDNILSSQQTVNVIHDNHFHREMSFINANGSSFFEIEQWINSRLDQNVFYFNSLIPSCIDREQIIHQVMNSIRFKKDLIQLAETIIQHHVGCQEFWGIHLRKTDFGNHTVKEQDYINWVKCNPDKMVFVCSDDPATEAKFCDLPNVFVHNKSHYVEKLVPGDWNQMITDTNQIQWPFNVNRTSASVQEAVIDLWCLSRSNLINTNINSTFFQIAQLIKEFRLVS